MAREIQGGITGTRYTPKTGNRPPTYPGTEYARQLKQDEFIAALIDCAGNIQAAAEKVGINRKGHYRWLKSDPTYEKKVQDAMTLACRTLEDEMVRRAVQGYETPVMHQGRVCFQRDIEGNIKIDNDGNPIPLTVVKYSDQLIMFIAKGWLPGKYGDRLRVTDEQAPETRDEVAERLRKRVEVLEHGIQEPAKN